ncbi:ribonuclease H-like domain-containing protein [Bacillus sp. FJAT-18017]|uniref:ribonuclease H-like domain-containing protein n=1 Tax=Bacillus sp. FJAT-18017 TaxID=1705566 RepID=UPI0006AE3F2A|nr:ribonuclease H-like domain-containing protein [Bacillus sp. FJAT-18017]
MSLKNKLNRLKPHLSASHKESLSNEVFAPAGTQTSEAVTEPRLENIGHDIPQWEEWDKAGVKAFHFDGQYCLVREVVYPLDYKHGRYRFSDFLEAVSLWETSGIEHPLSSKGHTAEELFFFDTETTGLGGGTGNTIFLLGQASVVRDKLILKQHILPHPGAEVPLYQSFLESINYRTLVTYNGKSFDWPQVKTRHTLVREHVPKLPEFGHFDLYHAARRLWKHKLDRMKLSVVETEVLEVEREDDIPGFLAPMIYFDYVETGRPDGMLGILKHNEIDILSLVTLYTHLTFQLCGMDGERTRQEALEVGKWFSAVGNHSEASRAYTGLIEGNDKEAAIAKLRLGYSFKKGKQWDHALEYFSAAAESHALEVSVEASIEAAKILEHKFKDYQKAHHFSSQACQKCESDKLRAVSGTLLKIDMLARLKRLQRKLNIGQD